MAYNKTVWVNRVTPVDELHMNKIENELENLDNLVAAAQQAITSAQSQIETLNIQMSSTGSAEEINQIKINITSLQTSIDSLQSSIETSNLTTNSKTIEGAINELNSKIELTNYTTQLNIETLQTEINNLETNMPSIPANTVLSRNYNQDVIDILDGQNNIDDEITSTLTTWSSTKITNDFAPRSAIPLTTSALIKDDVYTKTEINDRIAQMIDDDNSGDMHTSVYDKNNDGIVDRASVATVADSIDYSNIFNKPIFSIVSFSGDYNDLNNKPIKTLLTSPNGTIYELKVSDTGVLSTVLYSNPANYALVGSATVGTSIV